MPILLASLLGGLINIAGTLAGRVLIGLGISAITYTGLGASLDWLRDSAIADLLSLPPEIVGMLAVMKVGSAISIITSAFAVRMTLNGFTNGTVKRWTGF